MLVIAIPNLFVHQSILCYAKIIIIIVYLFTSSDKTIHRDLELLTSTSYTAVGSGFDLQGVPAEKPRNLLTHLGLLGLLVQCENIYLGPQMVHWTFAFTHNHHGKIIFKKVIFDLFPYA